MDEAARSTSAQSVERFPIATPLQPRVQRGQCGAEVQKGPLVSAASRARMSVSVPLRLDAGGCGIAVGRLLEGRGRVVATRASVVARHGRHSRQI
ncbi:hypothetical protein MRX96_057561 [Rhipicephalus microplus]